MGYEHINLDANDRIATLTLNRPDELNALSLKMIVESIDALGQVMKMEEVKALVIRGQGRAFCAGADLTYLGKVLNDPPALSEYLGRFNELLFGLEELPVPVIGLVQGFALAGGLELLLACDLVIAAEDARIGDQHINFALMPGGGSTQRLPRKVGQQQALELLLTGRWLTGSEAAHLGLVLRAVPADALESELEALLDKLRDKSKTGLGWIKSTSLKGLDMDLREGVALEIRSFVEYATTSDHPGRGIAAFKDKVQPKF